jgi:hypothetical protein
MTKWTLVSGDGWVGLYKDGVLVQEGHRLTTEDIFEHLGVDLDFVEADEGWLADEGNLPLRLDKVIAAVPF